MRRAVIFFLIALAFSLISCGRESNGTTTHRGLDGRLDQWLDRIRKTPRRLPSIQTATDGGTAGRCPVSRRAQRETLLITLCISRHLRHRGSAAERIHAGAPHAGAPKCQCFMSVEIYAKRQITAGLLRMIMEKVISERRIGLHFIHRKWLEHIDSRCG
jgi:hypothetical protein